MDFLLELPLGKRIPLCGSILGCSFRLRRHPENASHSELKFRDALSACGVIRKLRPSLSADSGMGLSAWAAIGKVHPTLRH